MTASVQPAFSFRSAEVSGELHRRNQPALKPYASDRPVLKNFTGPHVIYMSYARRRFLSPSSVSPDSSHLTPPPLRSRLRAATTRRRSPTTHAAARLHAASRAAAAAHSPHHRLRALLRRLRTRRRRLRRSRTHARAANTPPVRCRHRVPPRRRQGQSRRPCTTPLSRRSSTRSALTRCSRF